MIYKVFTEALYRSASDRARFLDEACAGNDGLRAAVEELLLQDRQAGEEGFLESLAPNGSPLNHVKPESSWIGRRIGPYEIRRWVASGGMGSVYHAVRLGDFRQEVAVKLVQHGYVTTDMVTRFATERQVLAALDHPHIARLLDGGATEDGVPYYVMEYIEGERIDRYCDSGQLPTRARVGFIRLVCLAIGHAHDRGVIHRDLKPANILVRADGTPKVTDFGLAKRLDDDSGQTRTGEIFGTPSYMAPEQASGKAREAGAPADIYALGAVLYELLTGRPPFKGSTWHETLEQVCSSEPLPPRRIQPLVPRDLETICLTCLAKEPAKRYASVAALVEDLRRHLAGEPIVARPIGKVERLSRWCHGTSRLNLPLWELGNLDEMFASECRALELIDRLAKDHPEPRYLDALGMQSRLVANSLLSRNRLEEAEAEIRRSKETAEKRQRLGPDRVAYLRSKNGNRYMLAQLQRLRGEPANAEQLLRQAVVDLRELTVLEDAARNHQELGHRLMILGELLSKSKPGEAEKMLSDARRILEGLADRYPHQIAYRQNLASIHGYLADAYIGLGRQDDARIMFAKSVAILEALIGDAPEMTILKQQLAGLLSDCPIENLRDTARACELLRKEAELQPQNSSVLMTLAIVSFRGRDWKSCVDAVDKLQPSQLPGYYQCKLYQAMAYWHLGESAKSREAYEQALRWMKESNCTSPEARRLRDEAAALLKLRS